MAAWVNSCRYLPTLGGTTDWTFASAVLGYNTPTLAGIVNGQTYKYRAQSLDLTQWEEGEGTYNTGTGVLLRTTVLYNSSGTGTGAGQSGAGTKISFTTVPQVGIVALKEDLLSPSEANAFTLAQKQQLLKNLGNVSSLGDASIPIGSGVDLSSIDFNNIVTDGFYFTEITCTNAPAAGIQYYLIVQKYPGGPNYCQQTAWDLTASGGAWTRNLVNSVWSSWVPLLNAGVQTLTLGQKNQAKTNIGAYNSLSVASTNLNSLIAPGFYDGNLLTNAPDGGTDYWYILVQSFDSNSAFTSQTAWGLNTGNAGRIFIRNNLNGAWQPWSQIVASDIPYSCRNIIGRNGGFEVWQRGTPVSVPASSTLYTVDGWYCWNAANEACTVTRVAGLTSNSRFAAKWQRNSGQTGTVQIAALACPLDADEIVKCIGNNLCISFTVKAGANFSPTSSVLGLYVSCGTGALPSKRGNSGYTGETAPIAAGFAITTTATRYSFISTFPVAANVLQMEVMFYTQPIGTAGADDSFTVDDVQLEVIGVGGIASTFERSDYQLDLLRCQRHFYAVTSHYLGLALNGSALYNGALKFPVTMRVAPTLSTGGTYTAGAGGPGTVAVRVGPTIDMVGLQNSGTAWTATTDVSVTCSFTSEI